MRFRAQAVSPEIESMPVFPGNLEIELMLACRDNLEIESTPVFPVNRGIEWTRVYRVNPETVWIAAGRDSQISVDPDVLVTTYKIFQAELPTEASGKIGAKRTWATFETIGKTIGAMLVIGTAIVGGTTITSIIRTIQDSVTGPVPRGRDSPAGAITAGRSPSITATETMFITKMARCTTETSRCARKPSTFSKPRRSR